MRHFSGAIALDPAGFAREDRPELGDALDVRRQRDGGAGGLLDGDGNLVRARELDARESNKARARRIADRNAAVAKAQAEAIAEARVAVKDRAAARGAKLAPGHAAAAQREADIAAKRARQAPSAGAVGTVVAERPPVATAPIVAPEELGQVVVDAPAEPELAPNDVVGGLASGLKGAAPVMIIGAVLVLALFLSRKR